MSAGVKIEEQVRAQVEEIPYADRFAVLNHLMFLTNEALEKGEVGAAKVTNALAGVVLTTLAEPGELSKRRARFQVSGLLLEFMKAVRS